MLLLILTGGTCLPVGLGAQAFAMHQYRVEDGLPSSFIYDIIQDKQGFMWISAEGGLCRFDGNKFDKNPIPEGLSTEVIELNVDSRGRLWMIDLASNIGCFDGTKLRWIEGVGTSYNFQVVNFKEDYLGNFWYLNAGIIAVDIQGEEQESYRIKYERKELRKSNSMVEGPDSNLYVISNFGVGVFENYKLTFRPFRQPFDAIPANGTIYDGKILFSVDNEFFFYDIQKDSLTRAFPEYQQYIQSKIIQVVYHDRNLWIATKDGVLLIENVASDTPKVTKLLDGIVAGNILIDHHGGYWFSTNGNGLFYLPNLKTHTIPTTHTGALLTTVGSNGKGNLVLGYDNSLIQILDSTFQVVHEKYLSPQKERIYEIAYHSNNDEYLIASQYLYTMKGNDNQVHNYPFSFFMKATRIAPDNLIWIGSSMNSGYIKPDSTFQLITNRRTYSVEPMPNGSAWLGTIAGLYYYDGKNAVMSTQKELQQDIQDIRVAADSTLWVATLNDGLWLYKNDSLQYHFNTENGLVSNRCRKIVLDDNYAWVATYQGVNQIDLRDFSSIYSIGKDEGLPSAEINDLTKSGSKIIVTTSMGLAFFEDTTHFHQLPVRLHIDRVKIQERDSTILAQYNLTHRQDNIKIEFTGVTFRHSDAIRYEYQMLGIDETWVSTNLGVAQYPSLSSGKYTFRLRGISTNTDWSEEQTIIFNISKAYWEQWWFYLAVVLLSTLLGVVFVRKIIQDYQRRNAIQEKLKNSQLIALRARMNPHFLFNALNSIQELIIRNDKRLANRYLAQFSRLMRNILNMSDQDEVSLQTEIESLELYLDLEALRFEKDFEFDFDIEQGMNTERLKIPSMLIQPYVENAIIHGLMHRRGVKKINISFRWEKPYLVVVVEDNGVGRKRAREINRDNQRLHASAGMGLTKNRLDLLNSTQQDHLSVRVEDLEAENGEALGTRVTVYIALKPPLELLPSKTEKLPKNIKT